MLTIKKYLFDYDEEIFVHLSMDVEPRGVLSSHDRFFRGEFRIKKAWLGTVNRNGKLFKIQRVSPGVFKTRFSLVEVCGRVAEDQSKIEIRFRPIWYSIIFILFVPVNIGILAGRSTEDEFVGWTVFGGVAVVQLLYLVLDLSKTEEAFIVYLHKIKTSRNQ